MFRQTRLLEEMLESLKTSPDSIISELYEMVTSLARPDNALVYLATQADLLASEQGAGLDVLREGFKNFSSKD